MLLTLTGYEKEKGKEEPLQDLPNKPNAADKTSVLQKGTAFIKVLAH